MAQVRSSELSVIGWIAVVLTVIGALNWALVGLFDLDVVAALFGPRSALSRIVYVLVGLSGLYVLYLAARPSERTVTRV